MGKQVTVLKMVVRGSRPVVKVIFWQTLEGGEAINHLMSQQSVPGRRALIRTFLKCSGKG